MVTRVTWLFSKFAVKFCISKNMTSQISDLIFVLLLMRTVPLNEFIGFYIKYHSFLTTCSWFERIRYWNNELQATRTSWDENFPKKTFISLTYDVDAALVGKSMHVSYVLIPQENKSGRGSLHSAFYWC